MALYNLKNPYDRQKFKERANAMVSAQEYVELTKKHTQRSLAQNSYLHLLLGYFASEFGYTLEEVKFEIFKKRVVPTEREMNTAIFVLRAIQLGLSLSELDELDEGFVLDMIIESANDQETYQRVASQSDFDSF